MGKLELARRRAPLRVTGAVALAALAVAALVPSCAASQNAAPSGPLRGTAHEVVFTQYAPLFSNAEIVRRLLSPLAQEAVRDTLARARKVLSPYPLDLAKERFLVYVPSAAPPSARGFALLVFVPPWDRAYLPLGWATQLDRYGFIFVAPERAGNEADVLGRRVPLALSAEANIVREYPVDPDRIYIGGFSGGSRVALRTALGYPDVFHGALLNAGADPLGGGYPLPPRNLFLRFQSSSHLVYVTGALDTVNLGTDADSAHSMRQWCVFDVETHETPDAGHELMSSEAFGRALNRLLNPLPPDPARLDACRAHVEAELEKKLTQAQALISNGRRAAARKRLLEIDARYGGLAAPRILQLARSCGCGLAGP
jgi:predicted esterase